MNVKEEIQNRFENIENELHKHELIFARYLHPTTRDTSLEPDDFGEICQSSLQHINTIENDLTDMRELVFRALEND